MRIDILAIGSRGDVQPCIALGLGLRRAGHAVRIVTLGGFQELVSNYGLEHFAIGDSPQMIGQTDEGRDWVKQRASTTGFLRGFVRVAGPLIQSGIARYWQSRRDADALVVSPMGVLVGAHLAEGLGVPLIQAHFAPPVVPSRYDWDGRTSPAIALRGRVHASIHAAFHFVIWVSLRSYINAARREILKLPALSLTEPLNAMQRKRIPQLAAYSPAVVPRVPDWGEWMHVTGYWFLDELREWHPPPALVEFLDAGPPPVFLGFGSTPFPHPDEATGLVIRAMDRAGQRGILIAGGSGLATGQLSQRVLSLDSLPHDWLFSRVFAAVHHGGAGVTGAALRAGLPSVVVPVFADQPFWGKRVFQLGAGPPPMQVRDLTEETLAAAIRATSDPEMRAARPNSAAESARKTE